MDRISYSGSDYSGSTPYGDTNRRRRSFSCCGGVRFVKSVELKPDRVKIGTRTVSHGSRPVESMFMGI